MNKNRLILFYLWWLYLLAIGSSLIVFAVRNEMKNKKTNFSLSETYSKIKERIDGNENGGN